MNEYIYLVFFEALVAGFKSQYQVKATLPLCLVAFPLFAASMSLEQHFWSLALNLISSMSPLQFRYPYYTFEQVSLHNMWQDTLFTTKIGRVDSISYQAHHLDWNNNKPFTG